ncbi:uncharacterized protein LY89DRAFT_767791 [Mollisia scopiformis]|uniref:Uncharacterized protein n=1 Tax=Mollisia scopiformis TaxID=149040 RepID=A0A194XMZ9_MOLSC|nr:uncharacterized protein LY89DRAFT_767791 [Mollisia scopiformis]KUJ21640.1 hypothetical protein LY89DRAFT_767791 [Mollisia scopiformis]
MIPVDIDDILAGIASARDLYEVGFQKASNPSPQYHAFGQEIRSLAINLDILSDVIKRAHYDAGASFERTQYGARSKRPMPGSSILTGFGDTLGDCCRLLNDQRYFHKIGRFVTSITWYLQIDPEVRAMKERLSCQNMKLSTIFKIIDAQVLRDRSFYITDSTAALLREAERLGQQFRGSEDGKEPAKQLSGFVVIPPELENAFMRFTQRTYPDLSVLTLDRGIDAAITYFNGITKREDKPTPNQAIYLGSIVDIMMASWILQAVRSTLEYETAAKAPSITAFERQMDACGLTIDRFFDVFDESLQEALRRLLGRDILLPPTPDLLETFERDRPSLPLPPDVEGISAAASPRQETRILAAEYGTKIMNVTRARNNASIVPRQNQMLIAIRDNYDFDHVEIVPSYALRTWATASVHPLTMLFKTDGAAPFSRNLVFQQNKDLFEFQQAITGFKVKHDDTRVLATSQESKILGGSRRQDLCRLQLWSAPPPVIDFADVSGSSSSRSTSEARRASQTSFSSSSTMTGQSRKKPSAPSMFSSTSRKSTSSRKSIAIDTPSLPGFQEAVTPEVTIEEELNENDQELNPSFRCVLERKSSYLQGRRSRETTVPSHWDLAAAGLHKRDKETEIVKRLKHVILEFDTRQNMSEFMTKFQQIKEIASWRLAKFVQATG